jgi:hypothetical protein
MGKTLDVWGGFEKPCKQAHPLWSLQNGDLSGTNLLKIHCMVRSLRDQTTLCAK